MKINKCRYCDNQLKSIFSLGEIPLVNYFPTKKEIPFEKKYPLNFCLCPKCRLGQIDFIIHPDKIFKRYHYQTSASLSQKNHLQELARLCLHKFCLNKKSKILDIGSNDGTLLSCFRKTTPFILGVEPAENIAEVAKRRGIRTITGFFNKKTAQKIKNKYGKYDFVFATHVLSNIVDIKDFIAGVKLLLKENGIFSFEVADLSQMIKNSLFDSIYHEHYSYFSLSFLKRMLFEAGFQFLKADKNSYQGGSIRIFATCSKKTSNIDYLVSNSENDITERDLQRFTTNVVNFREKIKALFAKIKKAKVAGFGAPAKGVTLLNFCGLGPKDISFIVDSTPFKQGRYMPGVYIPIFPEDHLIREKTDYIFLLAWNYQREIIKKIQLLNVRTKPKVIIPFPKLKIFELE
jgi:ubiquinone/menaquinone biosynthesis C-methylase UbiE